MKIAYFDCLAGISGDMILGALVRAGLPLKKLQAALKKLPVRGYRLQARRVRKQSLVGTKIDVKIRGKHRLSFDQMVRAIKRSKLSQAVKETSLRILNRLGQAEARVHGMKQGGNLKVSATSVHLHELGSIDTIIDIVGVVAGLELLNVKKVYGTALPLTTGSIKCAHGCLPLPAPATAELIKGWPVFSLNLTEELVTPTGAAILTTLAQPVAKGAVLPFTIKQIGYGAGEKNLPDRPNLLRVIIGEARIESVPTKRTMINGTTDQIWVLETNIDDLSPEIVGYLFEKVLAAGALDVFNIPIQMKKSRPGLLLRVLVPEDKLAEIESLIFSETSSFGIRRYPVQRTKLKRVMKRVQTRYGRVLVKIGYLGDRIKSVSPEYEDCRKLARRKNVPLKEIFSEVMQRAKDQL